MNLKKLVLLALSLFIFSGCADSNDPQPEAKKFIKSSYDIEQCNKESYTQDDLHQYKQLIKDGEIQGYNCVGLYYMRQKEYQKAEEYFNQGKEKGSIESYAQLGSLYSNFYDKKDDAIYYYLDAAKHGHAKSMHNLGVIFDQRFDYETALEWYNKSYATGDTYSLLAIGTIYLKQKKLKKAIETFEKVGQLGDSNGYYNLGILYKNNTEIKNYTKSKEYFHKCLDLGNAICAGGIGTVYENEKNYDKAIEWYKKGFELGSKESVVRLGVLYDEILKDYDKAIYWYTIGSEKLQCSSCANNLGYLYESVLKNKKEAKKWYERAIKLGSWRAARSLKRLEKENE